MAFYNNEYDTTLREFINIIYRNEIHRKLEIKNIFNNIFFRETKTDILAITNKDDIQRLEEDGYKPTTYDNYVNEYINASIKDEVTDNYKVMILDNTFVYQGIKYGISFKDKTINIVSYEPYKLIYSLNYEFNIKDCYIDSEGFMYICGEDILIKTHLMLNFYNEYNHECFTFTNEIESIFQIKVNDLEKLLSVDEYDIYYMSLGKVRHITLGKKYYFYKDGEIFFNVIDKTDKVTIQVEHLHIYDWISLLGLNNYRINSEKLNTNYLDDFKKIFYFPLGSNLNGLLNYSDFTLNKDYKVDLDINEVKIVGNFNYKYEKGLFKIKLKANRTSSTPVYITADLIKDDICIKRISGNSVNDIFYFCNLKFIFYKEFYYDEFIEFKVNITDDYSCKLVNKYEHLEEINIQDFDWISKIDQVFRRDSNKHQLVETDYENGYFIIRNYIKDSEKRAFNKDFGIRLIEKNGSPSLLWRQLKDKNYFLRLKNYLVTKKIKPIKKEKNLLSCYSNEFKLNLIDYEGILDYRRSE